MKYIISVVLLALISGCAGKKLVRNCHEVGLTTSGDRLAECEDL